jgi:putative hydrolase of the HAD superfamily
MQDNNTSIRTVIFDFGGVFTVSPIQMAREAAELAGIDPDGFIDFMLGSYAEESDHPWQRVERGEIALEDCRTWARLETKRSFGVEMDPLDVMGSLMTSPVRSAMVDLVHELRDAGLGTGLLTNNAREMRGAWGKLADWDTMFDAIIDSSEAGVRKPSATAFNLALERCGEVDPARAIMIDDFATNIAGAEAVGMVGVLVGEDPTDAISRVREMVR